ncbi:uncharacterized protein [Dysidea avara]|uniref:uncharacterized protein n=1 Tax=Dysidea avara TaxID=196820 RepID=UPI0033259710
MHGMFPSKTRIFCVQQEIIGIPSEPDNVHTPIPEPGTSHVVATIPSDSNDEVALRDVQRSSEKKIDEHLIPFSSFTLGRKLGKGGYGLVFLSELNGTFVAAKQIPLTSDEVDMSEINVLSSLCHPNIVVFMGYSRDEHHIYILTNYVHGGDLFNLLFKEKIPLSASDQLSITDQVAQALAYMHGRKPPFIHRDVKPMNILVEKGTFHVYLTDMGLARLKTTACTMTNVGKAEGTPYYSSPECFFGNTCLASDVWSFGLVLSEVFGRKHAWGKLMTHAEMAQLIVAKTLPSVQHLNPTIRRVCEGCLQYDEKKRINMMTVIQQLRE